MAQHDMNIANQGFPATRADINNALQAIATNNSGTSAPSTTFANQWFYNSNTNKLFIRNEANNAFIEVATLDQTNNEWQITTGQISAGDSDGLVFKTDDGTTRAVLDDSGHFVVGKSAADAGATAGIELRNDGNARFTKAGSTATFNRLTSDGAIATFQKAGTTVGTIGANGSNLFIGSPEGTDAFIGFGNNIVRPVTSAGASRDNAIDLGFDGMRFKDLYLSGGAFLGGTGSANKLDDVEEGTWTPTLVGSGGNPTVTYSVQDGRYTKIGRIVYIEFDINMSAKSGGSGAARISGLPFTKSSAAPKFSGDMGMLRGGRSTALDSTKRQSNFAGTVLGNDTEIELAHTGTNGSASDYQISDIGTGRIVGSFQYVV